MNEILNMYNDGKSILHISKVLHMHQYHVRKAIEKSGLQIRGNKFNSRRYSLNDKYFDEINTHEKAYWLGFIYADGYLTSNNVIGIALKSTDIKALQDFNEDISSTYKIYTYVAKNVVIKDIHCNDIEYCRLLIRSEIMFNSLLKHGVSLNKSKILMPPSIDDRFINSFILGYFDGDGSLKMKNNKSGRIDFTVSIMGTKEVLAWIFNFIKRNNLSSKKEFVTSKRNSNDTVECLEYCGNIQSYNIMRFLYKDSNRKLERKYLRFLELKIQSGH